MSDKNEANGSDADSEKKKVAFQTEDTGENKSDSGSEDGEKSEGKDSGYLLKVAVPRKKYGKNRKNTSQYTGLAFIPLNLFQQLKNPVFQFYLFIMILELIPGISVTNGLPLTLYPYVIIMLIQMMVDYFITFRVNKLDNIQNHKKVILNLFLSFSGKFGILLTEFL